MPLSYRNLIVVCSLACFCLLLATPVCGQNNYAQQIQPNDPFGTSVYQPSQIIDHSSMSPDSWSAPTVTDAIPYSTPSDNLHYSAAPNPSATAFEPNTVATLPRPSVRPEQAIIEDFDRQAETIVNRFASPKRASPSIPDLAAANGNQSPPQINSLIRQPETAFGNPAATTQPSFRLASNSRQSGLSLSPPSQAAPASPFQASAGQQLSSPQELRTSIEEFQFNSPVDSLPVSDPTQNLAIPSAVAGGVPTPTTAAGYRPGMGNNFQTAPHTVAGGVPTPTTAAGYRPGMGNNFQTAPHTVAGGVPTPTTAAGYPPGMGNNFQTAPHTNQRVTGLSSPAAYDTLLNQRLTTQPEDPRYISSGHSGSFEAQPTNLVPQLVQGPQAIGGSPVFRPDLGHRSPNPTFRGRDHDSGLKLDFEDKKKEYPGLGEILVTGRYFGSVSTLFLQPAFQQNSAITQLNSSPEAATFASSESFDFDYETAPRLRLGFESRFGPGVELDYWQFDQGSNVSAFTSNGTNSGQLSSGLFGPSTLTTLSAVNAGDTLSAVHSIDIETFSITFFKEIKFPISRLNGIFGFQYASVFQELDAELTDAGGNVTGAIRSTSDLRAYGPKFKFEYYRPIGHTNLEFVTAFGGSVLFGERDQIVTNLQTPAVNRFGADEFVLTSDFYGGVQWKKQTAENRAYYVRVGVTHQSWIGGGSAVSAQDNFGIRGFAFEVGLNR